MNTSPITLETLNRKIKGLIKEGLDSYWLTAEISEMTINYSGHCYLEFVQKSEKNEQLIARARATIWSNTFRMIRPYFETTTGQEFSEGIKVMVRVVIEFHEVYGLSLNVVDIEPTYTVGEIAVRKQKILEKLNSEGVLKMNKELELPYLLNRIAVISSKTSAGLEDFQDQLNSNLRGFKFYSKLFPAIMQGNEAEASIINQLDKIFQYSDAFDAVVIIRGGGATADLECFNSYWLAYNITQFPLPVLTGIGHEQDEPIVDTVANKRLKTPTAVAEFLIDHMSLVENNLLILQDQFAGTVTEIISEKKQELSYPAHNIQKLYSYKFQSENKRLSRISANYISSIKKSIYRNQIKLNKNKSYLISESNKLINSKRNSLKIQQKNIPSIIQLGIIKHNHLIDKSEQFVMLNNPCTVLSKGYSITFLNGKSVKNATSLKKGDEIETLFSKGKKKSIIK